MGEKLIDVRKDAGLELDAAGSIIKQFIGFCDFDAEDVLLDSNCGKGDFIIAASKLTEHALGAVSNQDAYYACLTNTSGMANVNILNSKLETLPFKRDMFSVVVNRFGVSLAYNAPTLLKNLINYTGNKGRLCIQDFSDFQTAVIDDFFRKFDMEIFNRETPVMRLEKSMIEVLGFRIIKEEITEVETDLMWYISIKNRGIIGMEKVNELIHAAMRHPEISNYVYLKNEMLCIKRRLISLMASR